MALQLGMSQRTYCRLENGESKLDLIRVQEISRLLQVEFIEIVEAKSGFSHPTNEIVPDKSIGEKNHNHYERMINFLIEENEFLRNIIKDSR
ncbi:MAG: helix-turn-helix domain-containing protein [Bacteroidales bacterium]|nr:helix-turn-helix domain-containing protein [Bacteroidales bacterium]MCF8387620.1 helix-turn-helix domain-containing protein [Bacteroidales bacterium]MCF8397295.1 helix-turn-helix domain-containing protein [Bacteroidales bacterium]